MSEVDTNGLLNRLANTAVQLRRVLQLASFGGHETGVRVKEPSLLLDDLDEAAALIQSQAAEISDHEATIRELTAGFDRLASAQNAIVHKITARAESAEADLARAREALEQLINATDAMGTAANMSMADDAIAFARAALPNTTGEAE